MRSSAATDEEGTFLIEGLEAGIYRVIPGPEGLPADERSEALVPLLPGGGEEVQLEIEPVDESVAVHVRGTLKFDSGRVPTRFSFTLWQSRSPPHAECHVEGKDGTFTKRLPFAGEFLVMDMKVEGEDYEDTLRSVQVADGANLPLVLEEGKEAGVLVVDSRTGEPVNGALVYREKDEDLGTGMLSLNKHNPPGPETLAGAPLRTDATGRASLGRGRGKKEIWVIADGFAWSRADVSFTRGGDARVELVPGGALQLQVQDWQRLEDAFILAWEIQPGKSEEDPPGYPLQFLPPDDAGNLSVDGIPAGRYLVKVRRGDWCNEGEVYGRTVVQVSPGERTTATISTTPPAPSTPVDVVLSVGGNWPEPPYSIRFKGLDPANSTILSSFSLDADKAGALFRVRTDPLPAGRYRVEVRPLKWTAEVAIPQGGGTLRLDIPGPGTLRLQVKASAKGEDVKSAVVHWTVDPEPDASADAVRPNDGPGRFRIVVPPGTVQLLVSGAGLRSRSLEVPVDSGAVVEHTVVLDASPSLTVRFTLDGKPYTGTASAALLAEKPSPGEKDGVRRFLDALEIAHASGGEATFTDFDPGDWALEILVDGMKEQPSRKLHLEAGTPVQVEVVLERK